MTDLVLLATLLLATAVLYGRGYDSFVHCWRWSGRIRARDDLALRETERELWRLYRSFALRSAVASIGVIGIAVLLTH